MYGSNINKSKEILAKYNVQYFYVDEYLLKYPMRVRTNLSQFLLENNINFSEVYDRYDIALPPERANMLNLLIIPPQNINSNFLDLFEPVYNVVVGGKTVSILYKLK